MLPAAGARIIFAVIATLALFSLIAEKDGFAHLFNMTMVLLPVAATIGILAYFSVKKIRRSLSDRAEQNELRDVRGESCRSNEIRIPVQLQRLVARMESAPSCVVTLPTYNRAVRTTLPMPLGLPTTGTPLEAVPPEYLTVPGSTTGSAPPTYHSGAANPVWNM